MRNKTTLHDPSAFAARRRTAGTDLVSRLLRESGEAFCNQEQEPVDLKASDRKWADATDTTVAWHRSASGGLKARTWEPALAVKQWYLSGKISLEELVLQLYFGRLSLSEVDVVASSLWGQSEGPIFVRGVVPGIIERISHWLSRPAPHYYPYVFFQSVEFHHRGTPALSGTQVAVAVGINERGYREVLSIEAASNHSGRLWESLLENLNAREVRAPRLVVGDTDDMMAAAVARHWPGCPFLVPVSELERRLLGEVRPSDLNWVGSFVTELEACGSRQEGERLARKLRHWLKKAGYAQLGSETGKWMGRYFAHLDFPPRHRYRLCSRKIFLNELKGVREQARILGPIRDEKAFVFLTAACFRRQIRISWNAKPVLNFK